MIVPEGATEDEIRAILHEKGVEQAADHVIAYRRFLAKLGSTEPDENGVKRIGPVFFAYAHGQVTAAELLERTLIALAGALMVGVLAAIMLIEIGRR